MLARLVTDLSMVDAIDQGLVHPQVPFQQLVYSETSLICQG